MFSGKRNAATLKSGKKKSKFSKTLFCAIDSNGLGKPSHALKITFTHPKFEQIPRVKEKAPFITTKRNKKKK